VSESSEIWIPTPMELEAEAAEETEQGRPRKSRRRTGALKVAPNVGEAGTQSDEDPRRRRR
jgi:hypothetical protein